MWKLLGKIAGYSILIPIWTILIAGMIPMMFGLMVIVSLITGDWNWRKLLRDTRPRYAVLPPPHRLRELDERDLEFIRTISIILRRRQRIDKVNWRRDGF
jgi:hypothetical protein